MIPVQWIRAAVTAVVACAVGAGLAYAKLPEPTEEQKAKAAAAKAKAAEAAKKQAEALARAQDRAVENYRRSKGMTPVSAQKTTQKAAQKSR